MSDLKFRPNCSPRMYTFSVLLCRLISVLYTVLSVANTGLADNTQLTMRTKSEVYLVAESNPFPVFFQWIASKHYFCVLYSL